MACYLEAVDLVVWRVTRDRMKSLMNPKKPTTSAENCLFESLSIKIFNHVFTLKSANKIWLILHELHDGTSNVREQKYCLTKQTYDSLK
jgi:hypothetical protein